MARILDDASLRQKPVVLQVLKVNTRGVIFYQRLGFTIVGESSTHFQMKKMAE
jgi:ribosomal protein S18 acetylase RimI-like enzyme